MTPEEELETLGLVHCPRVTELEAEGLAVAVVEPVGKTKRTVYKIKKKGQARIDAAQAHNAAILREVEARYQAAHVKELRWRQKADHLAKLRTLASKGI